MASEYTIIKRMTSIQPLSSQPVEESERHYLNVHVPFARDMFRRVEGNRAYYVWKALGQMGVNGSFKASRTAWYFISAWARMHPGDSLGSAEADNDEAAAWKAMVQRDIPEFGKDFRRFGVAPEVLVQRKANQAGGASYLFEFERFASSTREDAAARLRKNLDVLIPNVEQAVGIRRVVLNWAEREAGTMPVNENGQKYTGEDLDETTKVAFLEFEFDSEYWAEEFFRQTPNIHALLDPYFEVANGYLVDPNCVFDRRDEAEMEVG